MVFCVSFRNLAFLKFPAQSRVVTKVWPELRKPGGVKGELVLEYTAVDLRTCVVRVYISTLRVRL